jgi:hypothetical protein
MKLRKNEQPAEELVVCRSTELRAVVREAVQEALGESPEPKAVLLDRAGIARALCVSLPTVDRLRRDGMPTVWVCMAPRFELPLVLEWLRTPR